MIIKASHCNETERNIIFQAVKSFEMFSKILELFGMKELREPSRLLNYNFKEVLSQSGFLYQSFVSNEIDQPFKIRNFLAYLLIIFNDVRIILTLFIEDSSTELTLCDIGFLFGNTRLLVDAAFLSCYIGTIFILWAFAAINRREPHGNWICVYFSDQNIENWTHDALKGRALWNVINLMYKILTLVMMGIFLPFDALLISYLLFIPEIRVSRILQLPVWILFQFGQLIMLRGAQIAAFLFYSYCLIIKFRLDEIHHELTKLESNQKKSSKLNLESILKQYMNVYLEFMKGNKTLSLLIGSLYFNCFSLIVLMLFVALYSDASPPATYLAILIVLGAVILGPAAINLAGRSTTLSVSHQFSSLCLRGSNFISGRPTKSSSNLTVFLTESH